MMLLLLFEFLGSFIDDSDIFFQFEIGCKAICILKLFSDENAHDVSFVGWVDGVDGDVPVDFEEGDYELSP